jgi:hypothetical protein
MKMSKRRIDLSHLADKWTSTVVARGEVGNFSGGMVRPKYLANLDSKGEGPERIRIGRKIGYPVKSFVAWLEGRAQIVEKKKL